MLIKFVTRKKLRVRILFPLFRSERMINNLEYVLLSAKIYFFGDKYRTIQMSFEKFSNQRQIAPALSGHIEGGAADACY